MKTFHTSEHSCSGTLKESQHDHMVQWAKQFHYSCNEISQSNQTRNQVRTLSIVSCTYSRYHASSTYDQYIPYNLINCHTEIIAEYKQKIIK